MMYAKKREGEGTDHAKIKLQGRIEQMLAPLPVPRRAKSIQIAQLKN